MGQRPRTLEGLEALTVRPSRRDGGFWSGRRVLMTGHNGFKGSWTALWLRHLGAEVTGISLPAEPNSLGSLLGIERLVRSYQIDIRDPDALSVAVQACDPEVVLHMAAQPLVRRSLKEPVETFATNVMGTVNLLDALRQVDGLQAVLVVTTDKVYVPSPIGKPHTETDCLGGRDPYAGSKAACELATAAMADSYFSPKGIPVATARGGNVIGGGDFTTDRLVPDVVRSALSGQPLVLRNPEATRPWHHVLDCVSGYLTYLAALTQRPELPRALNFGPPPDAPRIMVGTLASAMLDALGAATEWAYEDTAQPPETHLLEIDSRLARDVLDWRDRLPGLAMIDATAAWYRAWAESEQHVRDITQSQIETYEALP